MSALRFSVPRPADRQRLLPFLTRPGERTQEFSFVNLLMWEREFHYRFCLTGDQLLLRLETDGRPLFSLPLGGDLAAGVEAIRACAAEEGVTPRIWAAEGPLLRAFLAGPGRDWTATAHRDSFEYLYEREALATLSGKKFHGKRNHIAAFSKQFDWTYEPLLDENLPDALALAREWYRERQDEMDESMQTECEALQAVLHDAPTLGVIGGLLRVAGRAVAFTFGSPLNDEVFDVHVEKALRDYGGAYAVINREFAAHLTAYRYLNREDDLGLEGLRRAKLSYHPAILLEKYTFEPKAGCP